MTGLPRHIHLVGIGGMGMSALAQLLHHRGHHITGSDLHPSAGTRRLAVLGIAVGIGHPSLPVTDLVVRSPAVPDDDPELAEAEARGVPVIARAAALGAVLAARRGIGIAGTHGKTTTTAMTAQILVAAGLDPTVVLGGFAPGIGGNFRAGAGPFLLFEACEGFGALQQVSCELACVLNVDDDHVEQFGSFQAIRDSFRRFLSPSDRLVVVSGDDPESQRLVADGDPRVTTFGEAAGSTVRADSVELTPLGSGFMLFVEERPAGPITLAVPGRHNVHDALAAIAVALRLGVPARTCCQALAGFASVGRRLEEVGRWHGATVVDDFGHHPTELAATLSTVRLRLQGQAGRLVAVFQPHSFSRTERLAARFAVALRAADVVVVTDIYPGREAPVAEVDAELIVAPLRASGTEVHRGGGLAATAELLASVVRPGDLLLTVGGGDVTNLGRRLCASGG